MPIESSVDSFIEASLKLLEAYPSSATLSVTYANEQKKRAKKSNSEADTSGKKATNSVSFKCYEPRSGKCIKYKTYKIKELSRLLTFIGPRGVSITKTRKRVNDDIINDSGNKRIKIDSISENTAGLASLMSNTKFEENELNAVSTSKADTPVIEDVNANSAEIATNPIASSSKNKKKKKKGKK